MNPTANIGANISVSGLEPEEKYWLTEELRDAMATLKWEIWKSQPQTNRAAIPPDYRRGEMRRFQDQMQGGYTLEHLEATRFHTKAELRQKDAFAHLDHLIPCRENAFLFRKI